MYQGFIEKNKNKTRENKTDTCLILMKDKIQQPETPIVGAKLSIIK